VDADNLEPLPPEAFSGWWLTAAIVLAVVAALALAGPWLWRRLRRPAAPVEPAGPPPLAKSPSQLALDEINRIEAAWAAGQLTDRVAAQGVAAAVKAFAGGDAATLTLLDLKLRGSAPDLIEVIEAAYPVEFGVTGEGDVAALAARARQAVAR
jgi:hypothetical protein